MADQVTWANRKFNVYRMDSTNWYDVAAVYIFAKRNAQGQWVALYVGRTGSLADRMPNHDVWPQAAQHGATHVHTCRGQNAQDRARLERAVYDGYRPRLNQRRPA